MSRPMTPERDALAVDYETHVCCGHRADGSLIYKISEHARSCPINPCTCGRKQRINLSTEKSMHAAWRKRAEEAELALISTSEKLERARKALILAEDHFRSSENCEVCHPIGDCPTLAEIRRALADIGPAEPMPTEDAK